MNFSSCVFLDGNCWWWLVVAGEIGFYTEFVECLLWKYGDGNETIWKTSLSNTEVVCWMYLLSDDCLKLKSMNRVFIWSLQQRDKSLLLEKLSVITVIEQKKKLTVKLLLLLLCRTIKPLSQIKSLDVFRQKAWTLNKRKWQISCSTHRRAQSHRLGRRVSVSPER